MEIVLPTLQKSERLPCQLVRLVVLAPVQVHPGDPLERLCGVRGRIGIERPRVGRLQVLDGVLLVSQEERETAEHELQATDVTLVVHLLVQLLRALRVAAGEHVVALALRDQRRLEVRARDGRPVAEVLRQLERTLDVVARRDVVAEPAAATRTPLQDVGAQQPTREPRPLGELERLVEERDRGRDARELVAAYAETEEHVGAVDIGELGALDELARPLQEFHRLAHLSPLLERPRLACERARQQGV